MARRRARRVSGGRTLTEDRARIFVAEGHRDLYEETHQRSRGNAAPLRTTILPRLRLGGVRLVVYAVCGDTVDHAIGTDRPMWAAIENLERFYSEAEQPGSGMTVVRWREDLPADDGEAIHFVLHFEGGRPLEGSVAALRAFYRLGLRSMQLVHNRRNELGDGVSERGTGGGLSRLGAAVLAEMERLGMVVDLAHASPATFEHAMRLATRPVVVSHSNCAAVCAHPRNLTDDQLRLLRTNGGLVGINSIVSFVDPKRPTLDRVVDHIDHLVDVLGADRVYMGGDFTKFEHPRSRRDVHFGKEGERLEDFEEAGDYPKLAARLAARGYADADVRAIMGGNLVRHLRDALPSRNAMPPVPPPAGDDRPVTAAPA